jgi:diguanylate cyclase (GGDEF)-like protein
MLDIDHFKRLNDSFGHPAGDAVLKNSARVLDRQLRRGDLSARYGGEEFVVILPGTEEAGAVHLAERIRSALEKSQLIFEGTRIGVTASLGVAVWDGAADPEALVAAADRALYAAKQGGRNQVRLASPEEAKAGGEA